MARMARMARSGRMVRWVRVRSKLGRWGRVLLAGQMGLRAQKLLEVP